MDMKVISPWKTRNVNINKVNPQINKKWKDIYFIRNDIKIVR